MACLFGHKWNGCTCSKCGKTRSSNHPWQQIPGKCMEKCSVCGMERSVPHRFEPVDGRCVEKCGVCGEERPLLHQFDNGKCVRCGLERSTLGPAPFVEFSDRFPASGSGAELADWLDAAVSGFCGQGSWELLEPACRAYSRCFAPIVMELLKGNIFLLNHPESSLKSIYGPEIAGYCLRGFLSRRVQNGDWDLPNAKKACDSYCIRNARPGMVHPGVMQSYLEKDLGKIVESAAAANPLKLPAVISGKASCDAITEQLYTITPLDSSDMLSGAVCAMLTEALQAAWKE